jgi:hypothetical protein
VAYGSVALWITRQYREREFRGRDCLTYDAPWGIDHDFVVKDDRYLAVHFVVIKVCGKIYGSRFFKRGANLTVGIQNYFLVASLLVITNLSNTF